MSAQPEIYTFKLAPDWKLINQLSLIDRFGGAWTAIERREGHALKQLKSIATVRSVGASTRIEGSKMTDDEVEVLLKNLEVSKLEDRDQQEVAGYFEALDLISESFRDIEVTESNLLNLHNHLMKYSGKDQWHKGKYKQLPNAVEATNPDGSKSTVFQTTEPGLATSEAMRKAVGWFNSDKEAHPVVRLATFIYEFLTIHPFQDGNGRMSRLLATLLLLKQGYPWIEYVSFEHEIENRKPEYYKVLMNCQRRRPGEDIHPWIIFFLGCLASIQNQLMKKLETQNEAAAMSPREKKIYQFVDSHPGTRSGEVAEKLNIPLPTTKKILSDMVTAKLLEKHGTGAGTNYTTEAVQVIKKDLLLRLTNDQRTKDFLFLHEGAFIEIKRIILAPKFNWAIPDEWAARLLKEGLYLQINSENIKGATSEQPYMLSSFNNPFLFQPVFTLAQPISIPIDLWSSGVYQNEYPLKASIALLGDADQFSFDVLIVYDEAT